MVPVAYLAQLEATQNEVFSKLRIISRLYGISLLAFLLSSILGIVFLATAYLNGCSFISPHIMIIISIFFNLVNAADFALTNVQLSKFLRVQSSQSTQNNQNNALTIFLSRVETARRIADYKQASIFQVKEGILSVLNIPFKFTFTFCHLLSWIAYCFSFYFIMNFLNEGCLFQHESLILVPMFFYHNVTSLLVLSFSLVVSLSSIVLLPVLLLLFIQDKNPLGKQKVGEFLTNLFYTEKFNLSTAKDPLCAICLENFMEGAPVKIAKCCKSPFHLECISKWALTCLNCPNCRSESNFKRKELALATIVPENQIHPVEIRPIDRISRQNQSQQINQDKQLDEAENEVIDQIIAQVKEDEEQNREIVISQTNQMNNIQDDHLNQIKRDSCKVISLQEANEQIEELNEFRESSTNIASTTNHLC